VVLDTKDGGNGLIYLPVDQLIRQHRSAAQPPQPQAVSVPDDSGSRQAPVRPVDRDRRNR